MTSPSCSYNAVPPRPPNSLEEEPGQQPANTQTMTRQQEPLGQSTEQTDQAGDGNVGEKPLKPDHVSEDHWKVIGTLKRVQVSPLLPTNLVQRFMELKMRREQQSARSSRKRTNELRRASLTAVRKAVSICDIEEVLKEEGINISLKKEVKLSKKKHQKAIGKSPQKNKDMVSVLLSKPTLASSDLVPQTEQQEARKDAELSGQLSQEEIDVGHRKKRPKLQWRFERKQRWESKGNM